MLDQELVGELKNHIPLELAEDIVKQFMSIKGDVATITLGRSAPGKFVETIVQILQYISEGHYSEIFKTGEVDNFLKNAESRQLKLPLDLKINVTRVARCMYSLRNKRGIIHKGTLDPNIYDLRYLYSSAQWTLSEIIRNLLSTEIDIANQLVEFIQIPAPTLVEDFGGKRLVLITGTAAEELLTLLLFYYPNSVLSSQLHKDMDRFAKQTVTNTVTSLYNQKLIEGNTNTGYKLTILGHHRAIDIAKKITISLRSGGPMS